MNNQSISLAMYINEWLTTYKATTVKQSTYDRLLTSAHTLKNFKIADMPICEITSTHVQQYINELVNMGYGLSTIKKQIRIVTVPLKQAIALNHISSNPIIGIQIPSKNHVQKESKLIESYSKEDQVALYKVLDPNERRGYPAIILMIETGLRVGEVLALRWKDVHLSRKRLYVRSTVVRLANKKRSFVQDSPKSESSNRVVPLTPKAIDVLTKIFTSRKSDEWVFTDEYGDRLSYESLRWQTQCACKIAKIKYHGMHVFRHTFATNCYYKNVDVKILSKILGHSDTTITYNIYVHLYGDGFEDMYNAIVK